MDGFHAVLERKKKDFKFERSFTQECKYCCGFLCIFPVCHAVKSLMCEMKYGVFNLVRDCNLKAVMYSLVFFIFKTHCIYVYYYFMVNL